MNHNAVPKLVRAGAAVVASCLVLAAALVGPAFAADAMDRASATGGEHAATLAQAFTVLASADRYPLRLAQAEKPRVSLDDAVSKVRSRYEGRVIRAETRYGQDGRPTHYVKLLSPNGRVRTIRVDGRTGRVR